MKVIKVQKQGTQIKVFFEDGTNVVIPYLPTTKYYKITKEYLDGGEIIEPEFTDDELFKTTQDTKITLIDSTTKSNIEALVGDDNKQKDKIAEHGYLSRLEANGKASADQITRANDLEDMWIQVTALKASGNDREVEVKALTLADFSSLDEALSVVEAI